MSDELWTRRPDWARGEIRSALPAKVSMLWHLGVLSGIFSIFALWVSIDAFRSADLPIAIGALVIPALAIAVIIAARRRTRRWRAEETALLRMDPVPGSIDGHVGGRIELGVDIPSGTYCDVSLSCFRSRETRGGDIHRRDRKQVNTSIVWQAPGPGRLVESPQGAVVEFRYDVPAGLPESGGPSTDYHYWVVALRTSNPMLEHRFTVPVFRTGQRAASVEYDSSAEARAEIARDLEEGSSSQGAAQRLAARHGLELERRDGWLRLHHPAREKWGFEVNFGYGGLFFGAFGLLFLLIDDPIAKIAGSVVTLIACALAAAALYIRFNALDARVSAQQVSVYRRWFGLTYRRRTIPAAQIQCLELRRAGSEVDSSRSVIFYEIDVCHDAGEHTTVSRRIAGESAAQALLAMLCAHLDKPVCSQEGSE